MIRYIYKYHKIWLTQIPQLIPFFFLNQTIFTFLYLIVIIYFLSKYILPRFVRLFISRVFVRKL